MFKFMKDLGINFLFFNSIVLLVLPENTSAYTLGELIAIGVYICMFVALVVRNFAFKSFRFVGNIDTLWELKQKVYNQGLVIFIILMLSANWLVSVFHCVVSVMLYYRLHQYFGEIR